MCINNVWHDAQILNKTHLMFSFHNFTNNLLNSMHTLSIKHAFDYLDINFWAYRIYFYNLHAVYFKDK